ncbi:MAG: hypothetical protein M0Q94_11495 [Candidatus Cloacimonetes bacterium]|nr:hypothetical protein [Candidatus Cloacimonadota bacterium]
MSSDTIKKIRYQHLKPRIVSNKDLYLTDLNMAVSRSFSGRIGAEISTAFLFEAEHMIANSIRQYEQGMFDAAFYSLRATLEIFMLLVYFIEHQDLEISEHVKKWNNLDRMDTYSIMDKYLSKNSELYADIKGSMSKYFESLKDLNGKLNKKVHKQSFLNFYTHRNHFIVGEKYDIEAEQVFYVESLRKIIGAVVVFRLFIDPMPILLMDEEVFLRTKDTMSGPLHEDFIERYIGKENIEDYKKCDLYQNHYQSFMRNKKLSEPVAYLLKFKTIDITKKDEIEEQFSELYDDDKLAFRIACESNKIYAIDIYNGMRKYLINTVPENMQPYYRNMEYEKYFNLEEDILNLPFEDIFISIFVFSKHRLYVEQAEKLDKSCLVKIRYHIDEYTDII